MGEGANRLAWVIDERMKQHDYQPPGLRLWNELFAFQEQKSRLEHDI